MGWVTVVQPAHHCEKPYVVPSVFGIGSIWECSCGTRYRLVAAGYNAYDDPMTRWEAV